MVFELINEFHLESFSDRMVVIVGNCHVACKNALEEHSEGKMGKKRLGDDRGRSVAQERRRCKHGRITSQERGRDDGHMFRYQRVYITCEDLEVFGFTARCLGCLSLLKGRQANTENCRKRIEEEFRSTVQAEAAQRRVKEYQDQAAERKRNEQTNNLGRGRRTKEHRWRTYSFRLPSVFSCGFVRLSCFRACMILVFFKISCGMHASQYFSIVK